MLYGTGSWRIVESAVIDHLCVQCGTKILRYEMYMYFNDSRNFKKSKLHLGCAELWRKNNRPKHKQKPDNDESLYRPETPKKEGEEAMGTMSCMEKTGDEKLAWDPRNDIETRKARDRFYELIKDNYKAYRINHSGERGEELKDFDPLAIEIVFHKYMSGG